jgi:hypothetical protein
MYLLSANIGDLHMEEECILRNRQKVRKWRTLLRNVALKGRSDRVRRREKCH